MEGVDARPASAIERVDREGERRFHIALAGIFGLFLAPLVSVWAAVGQPAGVGSPWRRRLFALAALDLVLIVGLAVGGRATSLRGPETATRPAARIGVTLGEGGREGEVEVAGLVSGSPAERAGLLPGDRVVELDGIMVRDSDAFRATIEETPPGSSRSLRLQRGSSRVDVVVVPVAGLTATPRTLFERTPRRARPWSLLSLLRELAGYLAALATLAALALAGASRGAAVRPVAFVMVALASSVLAMILVALGFERTLGPSIGATLLSMIAGALTMLGAARFAMRRMALPGAERARPDAVMLATWPALATAIFYTLAGSVRAGLLVSLASARLHLPDHPASEVFAIARAGGPGGLALFAIAAVVIAPIAEESLFRGVLLPWLSTWMKPVAALWVSAVTFGVGHLYYGVSFLITVVYGASLGWLRLRTGRLRAGIALHMLLNATATAMLIFKA